MFNNWIIYNWVGLSIETYAFTAHMESAEWNWNSFLLLARWMNTQASNFQSKKKSFFFIYVLHNKMKRNEQRSTKARKNGSNNGEKGGRTRFEGKKVER